jgi:hypothetical protein
MLAAVALAAFVGGGSGVVVGNVVTDRVAVVTYEDGSRSDGTILPGSDAEYGTETGYALPDVPVHGETVCVGTPGEPGAECATWDDAVGDWTHERPYLAAE